MSKAATTLIQTGLAQLGYSPGAADGLFGKNTRAAAEAWLKAGGAPAQALPPAAAQDRIYQGAARHPVDEIILHCSATRPGWMATAGIDAQLAEIRLWHMRDNGWNSIGYHWLIGRDGSIRPGRRETEIGAHVAGHNLGSIGICLIGGHGASARDPFIQHFTRAQDTSARQLIQAIGMRTPITKVTGHNDYAAKACPGFTVSTWLKEATA